MEKILYSMEKILYSIEKSLYGIEKISHIRTPTLLTNNTHIVQ
jgi:hypothetical protein